MEIIFHPQLGELRLMPRQNMTRIKFTVHHNYTLVSYPCGVSLGEVRQSVEKMKEKLLAMIKRLQCVQQQTKNESISSPIQEGEEIRVLDRRIELVCGADPKFPKQFNGRLRGDKWILTYPSCPDVDGEAVQRGIRSIITKILKTEAQEKIVNRVESLAERYGFNVASVKINSAKGRWGSCSSKRGSAVFNINISCYLLLLPERLIDYIIVHELCHTRYMNHSAGFYQLWHSFFSDSEGLDQQLEIWSRRVRRYHD